MRPLNHLLIFLRVLVAVPLYGQDHLGDSLATVARTAKDDSVRIHALRGLAGNWLYAHGQMDSTIAVVGRAVKVYDRLPPERQNTLTRDRLKLYEYADFALHQTGHLDEALLRFQAGARMAEEKDLPVEVAGFYMYMSQVFGAMHDNTSVRTYSQRALDILEPMGPSDDLALARYTMAAYHVHEEHWDSAEHYAKLALTFHVQEHDASRQMAEETMLLQIYHRTRQSDSAEAHLGTAERIAAQVDYPPSLVILQGHRARIELFRGQYTEAIASIDSSIALSSRLGLPFDRSEAYRVRSIALAALHRVNEAFMASDSVQAIMLRDMGLQEQRKLTEVRMGFERDKERALATADLARQRTRTGLATGLALLGAVIAVVLWHLYRLRARTAVALREKNMEIRRAQDQLVESEKQHEAEKVRTRIARDIHDEIGATLTKIRLLSDVAASIPFEQHAEMQRSLQRIGEHAKLVSTSMSDIVWAVDPARDTHQGMLDHVRELAHRLLGDNGITYDLDLTCTLGSAVLEPELRRDIHLLINEALNNILKYARAGNVKLSILLNTHHFTLRIQDDGAGFDPSRTAGGGNGLRNMRDRAQRHGGSFRISSTPGKGTCVDAHGAIH
ncbi:MAG TPA: ATP-binding protein [Flavobacteriales bacterium]|nr:ATP-binding protein [Flavobacteriales bacterium]